MKPLTVGALLALGAVHASARAQTQPPSAPPPSPAPQTPSAPPPTNAGTAPANASAAVPAPAPAPAPAALEHAESPAAAQQAAVPGAVSAPAAAPAPAAEPLAPVQSKFRAQLYGFVELDAIEDSTQSFSDVAGNGAIVRPGAVADHARTTFGARNSRLGLKMFGPGNESVKTSAMIEMDFLGNQPGNPPAFGEGPFFTNPTFRIRHMAVKLETPIVDVLAGQYWELFGWQAAFDPNTVEIQGVPGEVYSRAPQLRLSHVFKTDPVNLELAVAASRAPQRDSGVPDGQAGVRVMLNDWQGYHTAGATGTALDAASLGVSGTVRRFSVTEFSAAPKVRNTATGWGLSVDGLIPIVPATKQSHDNALTLTASFAVGTGISDLYTGLTGGIGFPTLPNPGNVTPAPTYSPDVDAGLVTYDAAGALHTVNWQSFIVGAQYYLPVGHVWVSANYSQMHSSNIGSYGAAGASVYETSHWYDANVFWDILGPARVGAEYAHFSQKYVDGVQAKDDRVQASAFYIF